MGGWVHVVGARLVGSCHLLGTQPLLAVLSDEESVLRTQSTPKAACDSSPIG